MVLRHNRNDSRKKKITNKKSACDTQLEDEETQQNFWVNKYFDEESSKLYGNLWQKSLQFDEKAEYHWESLDFDYEDGAGDYVDDDDIQLQEILLNSAQTYNSSVDEKLEFDFANKTNLDDDVKKKGVDVSSCLIRTNGINKWNSKYERGETSCIFCTICNDVKPVNSVMRRGKSCEHSYCEECIRNYVVERIKDNITEVKCPVSNCKEILEINESLMPADEYYLIDRWSDAVREARVLASCVGTERRRNRRIIQLDALMKVQSFIDSA
ncbi:hypothetical protein A4A49_38871 [Nicotiana attenuata]|uniref:RING-type domain-containing protein n=1 Tax=Nicotiana attenuata TaxID=49451 RepID=A0A1J6KKU7_NICAT|nr:hypothetical protein A4A49_38871 [Nicotiana attenuata]